MSLERDFSVILTDQEFRELIGEALYHRQLLKFDTPLAVRYVNKDLRGKWRVVCARTATKAAVEKKT